MDVKSFPDLAVGDEVSLSIEYFGEFSDAPPSWRKIWFDIRWRIRTDWYLFVKRVKSCLHVR